MNRVGVMHSSGRGEHSPRPVRWRGFTSAKTTIIGLAIAALLMFPVLVRLFSGGFVAATPPAFVNTPRLSDAIVQNAKAGKPILAFATADWCGPCQQMKRETLVDPKVAEFIRTKTVPVYVNIDQDADAGRLRVFGIPATFVIVGDTVIAKSEGYLRAADYLSFLEAAVELAGKPEEIERLKREANSALRR